MIIPPDTNIKVGAIISSIHKDLVWDAEKINDKVLQMNVYFKGEPKSKGIIIQEFCEEGDGLIVCVSKLIVYFLRGKLDNYITDHV